MAHMLSSAAAPEQTAAARPPAKVCMHVLGVGRTDMRVMREATALRQAGFDVVLVDLELDRQRPREEWLAGIQLRHLQMPDWLTPTRFKPWFLVKLLRAFVLGTLAVLRTSADIYHAHDDIALPACYLAARLRGKSLVFDAHELPLVQSHLTRWRRLCGLSRLALRKMMARCSGVITVSPPIVTELQRRYGGPPACLVRNVPVYQAPVADDRLRRQLGLSPQTRVALYQGYFSRARDLDRLIQAAKFLDPDIAIVLLGRGATEAELAALILQEGVGDRVKLFPWVPYEELLALTASADLGLVLFSGKDSLSVKLCLPNKLFEYLMAGLPVLATPLDAVVDVLETYDVGAVVRSLEPVEIGRALNALLADPAALARMQRNALAAAREHLCWEQERQQLIAFYIRLLGLAGAVDSALQPA